MSSNTRRVSFGLALLVTGFVISGTPARIEAQTITPAEKALIDGLHSGNWSKRATAAAGLSKQPYSNALCDAVMREVDRLQRKPDHGLSERPKKVRAEEAQMYYSDLMSYVTKSNDVTVIPALVKGVNANREVVERVARFGEAAVPMLTDATHASSDPAYIMPALRTLRLMIERQSQLSASSRSRIIETVLERLRSRQASEVMTEAIAVAAVLEDPRVRKRLSEIAAAQPPAEILSAPEDGPRVAAAAAAALTLTAEQRIVINNFRSLDWLRRFEASRVMLNMAPGDRPAEMYAAVIDELKRLQKSPGLGADLVPASVQDRSIGSTYYRNLIEIASDASDPSAIPVLLKAITEGERVVRGLARFEEAAVPATLEVIRQGDGPEETQPALVVLRRIAEHRPELSPASRTGMVDVTLLCLKGKQQSSVVVRAIELARVLNDERLNTRLSAIVQARSAHSVELELTDAEAFSRVQAAARLALPEKR